MPGTHVHPLHRVTIGRTREVRGPDALERAFVGLIIAVAAMVAVAFAIHSLRMVQSLDAISLASGAETDAIVHRAVHGAWPAADEPGVTSGGASGHYVTRVRLVANGLVTANLAAAPTYGAGSRPRTSRGVLAFRPELLGSADAPAITYLCGYAKPVAGGTIGNTPNPTTTAKPDLPPFCR